MANIEKIHPSRQRVLVFSAQTPPVLNKPIYFLFSQRQMDDILMDASVRSVPFSPAYVDGVAEWRNQMLPVISLEACLGMDSLNSTKVPRLMVVRALKSETAPAGVHRIMFRIVPPVRMLTLPIECSPVSAEWIPKTFFTRGVFEWNGGFLVVAHMRNILNLGK